MWYRDVNSVKTDFLILSSPFRIHSILKLAPVLSQKTSTVTPIFHLMILIRTALPFDEKTLEQIYVQFFGNFTKLYGLSHHGSE